MNNRKIFSNIALVLGLLAAGSSFADETSTTAPAQKLPGDQGLASVNKNLEKNPENKGLQNASEQLKRNQLKHAEHMEKRAEKREEHRVKKAERAEKHAQHHEAMGRPAKIERPGK